MTIKYFLNIQNQFICFKSHFLDTALPQDNSMNGSNQFSSFFSPKSASKKSTALMSAKKGSPQTKKTCQQIRALKPGSSPSPHTPTTPHYFLGHKTKQAILTDMLKVIVLQTKYPPTPNVFGEK